MAPKPDSRKSPVKSARGNSPPQSGDRESSPRGKRGFLKGYKRLIMWSGIFLALAFALGVSSQPHTEHIRQYFPPFDMEIVRNFTDKQLAVFKETVSSLNFFSARKSKFRPHPEENLKPKHPVVLIPGFVSSALEIWEADECIKAAEFRQRLWGSFNMIKLFIQDPTCWFRHLMLGPDGLDPPGIRLRPAHGFESADFFIGQYFVWAIIIEALGGIGYDTNSMFLASYDWRMNFIDMEIRDRFFTRLAASIEQMKDFYDEKVVIVIHSYGAKVWNFFMHWVEHHRGIGWIDRHVVSIYNVAPAMLGVPKAFAALLAGEMSDTSTMGTFGPMFDSMMNATERATLWRSWGALHACIPKGGTKVWGPNLFKFDGKNTTVEEAIEILRKKSPNFSFNFDQHDAGSEVYDSQSVICPNRTSSASANNSVKGGKNACYKKEWSNPMSSRLPAGNYTIHCVYGLGQSTETGYHFVTNPITGEYKIDTSSNSPSESVSGGIYSVPGDKTVPYNSLGYVCENAWKKGTDQNPYNITVNSRELSHNFTPDNLERFILGASGKLESSEHVDILGHHIVLEDIVALASGRSDLVKDGGVEGERGRESE
jgi:phospholipid:diacylglycerol acyltransferase